MRMGSFAGRVGKDAELRYSNNGKQVLNWPLAVDIRGGKQEKGTLWLDCSMWGDRAEKLAPYITKGSRIALHGDISTHPYVSQGGEPRAGLKCTVYDVTLMGGDRNEEPAPGAQARAPHAAAHPRKAEPQEDLNDDIPF